MVLSVHSCPILSCIAQLCSFHCLSWQNPQLPDLAPAAAPCLGVDFAKGTVHLEDLRRPDGSPTFEEFTVTGGDVTRGRSAAW